MTRRSILEALAILTASVGIAYLFTVTLYGITGNGWNWH